MFSITKIHTRNRMHSVQFCTIYFFIWLVSLQITHNFFFVLFGPGSYSSTFLGLAFVVNTFRNH